MAELNAISVAEEPQIAEIVRTIVEAFDPERIVLFGSRATGRHRPDSDVDLMVEMETSLPWAARAAQVSRLFYPRFWSMDVMVYTPDEVRRQRRQRYSVLREIERTGKVLYER